jgi:hypothetical protein
MVLKRIVIYDIDSKIPNLALMKISAYHKKRGYDVKITKDIRYIRADYYFSSSVFHNERSNLKVSALLDLFGSDIQMGGSGCSLKTRLPDEIDACFPDYELYNHKKYAIGFLTRGCNKSCRFCLVPKKEGRLNSQYATFDDFVPKNQRNIMLLDNNILSSDNATEILELIIKKEYIVNFSQTLDIDYLTIKNDRLLKKVKSANSRFTRPMIYFSCNTLRQSKTFFQKEQYLKSFGRNAVTVLIMFGFNTKLSEDYAILMMAKKLGLIPFVQEYMPVLDTPSQIPEDYFDMDLDLVAALKFRTNGQNNEKFLRYVNKLYFQKFGKYYLPLLNAIYRYNNKLAINKYLRKPNLISQKQYA